MGGLFDTAYTICWPSREPGSGQYQIVILADLIFGLFISVSFLQIYKCLVLTMWEHAVTQLVEALRYKPVGRGLHSQ